MDLVMGLIDSVDEAHAAVSSRSVGVNETSVSPASSPHPPLVQSTGNMLSSFGHFHLRVATHV